MTPVLYFLPLFSQPKETLKTDFILARVYWAHIYVCVYAVCIFYNDLPVPDEALAAGTRSVSARRNKSSVDYDAAWVPLAIGMPAVILCGARAFVVGARQPSLKGGSRAIPGAC